MDRRKREYDDHPGPGLRRSKWDSVEMPPKDHSPPLPPSMMTKEPEDTRWRRSDNRDIEDRNEKPGSRRRTDQTDRNDYRRRNRSRSRSPHHPSRRRSRSPVYRPNDRDRPSHSAAAHRNHHRSRSRSPKSPRGSNSRRSPPPRAIQTSEHTRLDPPSQDKPTSSRSISTTLLSRKDDQHLIRRSKSPAEDRIAPPPSEPKDEPNFNLSGKLAAETKTFKGVVLKYHEPPEARKPTKNWRLYVFKGQEQIDIFHIHRQSAYLFGRDRVVVDIPIDHPSSSKQHAVVQFRQVSSTNEFGDSKTTVKPFIIDLESANGTLVNGEKIPVSRFYELQSGDVIKFGFSTREFVLIPET